MQQLSSAASTIIVASGAFHNDMRFLKPLKRQQAPYFLWGRLLQNLARRLNRYVLTVTWGVFAS